MDALDPAFFAQVAPWIGEGLIAVNCAGTFHAELPEAYDLQQSSRMKTYRNLYSRIWNFENLYLAY